MSGHISGSAGKPASRRATPTHRNASRDDPLYSNHFQATPAALPYRATPDNSERPRHPRPTAHGLQTAVVVGLAGNPIHTDRDHRIRVQFHWQRGANASHRLDHPSASTATPNAPANEASSTWVRVATPSAGANWGSAFIPRLGQEVLIDFIEGDIDRPVVIGSLYNGVGQSEAQGNRIGTGAASATGNAPAWFPGGQADQGGKQASSGSVNQNSTIERHAHRPIYAGFKTQELSTSQSGQGGHNQLLLDLTPGEPRLSLETTQHKSALHLGALRHQDDNQRLQATGHGIELKTEAQGAARAGAGLLISTERQAGSTASGQQLASRGAQAQLEQASDLNQVLTESAQKHNAKLKGEPEPKQTGVYLGQQAELESLGGTDQRGAAEGGEQAIGGGTGPSDAWKRPGILLSAGQGIVALSPAYLIASAGQHISLTAGQDVNLLSQRQMSFAVKAGVVVYSYGKAEDATRPVNQTGIQLHAASGNVAMQAQTGKANLTAQKRVEISSTTEDIKLTAPEHILLTAGGSYIKMEAGNIEIGTAGNADFWASLKVWSGPESAAAELTLKKPGSLKICEFRASSAANGGDALVAL